MPRWHNCNGDPTEAGRRLVLAPSARRHGAGRCPQHKCDTQHSERQAMAIRLRTLVVALTLLGSLTAAVAVEVQIRGLTEQTAVRADSPRARAYLTGTCQQKRASMHCHLHQIE